MKWMRLIIYPLDGWGYLGIDKIEHLHRLDTKGTIQREALMDDASVDQNDLLSYQQVDLGMRWGC